MHDGNSKLHKGFHDCVYLMLMNYGKIQIGTYLSFATIIRATARNRLIPFLFV